MSTSIKIFLSLVIVITVGVGLTLNSKKEAPKPINPPLENIKTEEVDGLDFIANPVSFPSDKLYRNDKYGFEFQHNLSHELELGPVVNGESSVYLSVVNSVPSASDYLNIYHNMSQSLDSFIEEKQENRTVGESRKATLGGEPAYEVVSQGMLNSYGLVAKKDENIYFLSFDTNNTNTLSNLKAGLNDDQKKIIDTFKFFTPSPTQDDNSLSGFKKPEEVLMLYFDYVSQQQISEAVNLWSPNTTAISELINSSIFDSDHNEIKRHSIDNIRLITMGQITYDVAAGSQYAVVPVEIEIAAKNGKKDTMVINYTLRRSNITTHKDGWKIYYAELN